MTNRFLHFVKRRDDRIESTYVLPPWLGLACPQGRANLFDRKRLLFLLAEERRSRRNANSCEFESRHATLTAEKGANNTRRTRSSSLDLSSFQRYRSTIRHRRRYTYTYNFSPPSGGSASTTRCNAPVRACDPFVSLPGISIVAFLPSLINSYNSRFSQPPIIHRSLSNVPTYRIGARHFSSRGMTGKKRRRGRSIAYRPFVSKVCPSLTGISRSPRKTYT